MHTFIHTLLCTYFYTTLLRAHFFAYTFMCTFLRATKFMKAFLMRGLHRTTVPWLKLKKRSSQLVGQYSHPQPLRFYQETGAFPLDRASSAPYIDDTLAGRRASPPPLNPRDATLDPARYRLCAK